MTWLIQELGLRVPQLAVRSEIVSGARKSFQSDGNIIERYPRSYLPEGILGNVRFALRYEPINLGVYSVLFAAVGAPTLEAWVKEEPTGRFTRRAWYLYELITGRRLDLPDVMPTGYVDLQDPSLQITGQRTQIRRQRINDNLLGHRFFCPLLRRTPGVDSFLKRDVLAGLRMVAETIDPLTIARVGAQFGQPAPGHPNPGATTADDKLGLALQTAEELTAFNKQGLLTLHSILTNGGINESDWRRHSTALYRTQADGRLFLKHVLAKPEDVPVIMLGWQKMAARLMEARPPGSSLESSLVAALVSLSLLLIHPFEDGNGRLQRVIAEAVLRRLASGLPLPLARVLEREKSVMAAAEGRFFQSIEQCLDFSVEANPYSGRAPAVDAELAVEVKNDSAWLYRYADVTPLVEVFCASLDRTIREEVRPALAFYAVQESALRAVRHVVDLPGLRANALVRLLLLYRWQIPEAEQAQFPELRADQWQKLAGFGSQYVTAACR